jgi:hypothetical protein
MFGSPSPNAIAGRTLQARRQVGVRVKGEAMNGRLLRLVGAGAILAGSLVVAGPANAANVTLASGATLSAGQSINTGTGCQLVVQAADGNVVEYCNGVAVFNTHTYPDAGDRLVMQTDGNLVVYKGSTWLWQSGTAGHPGARLVLQDDHNLVVYQGSTPLWAQTWTQNSTGTKAYAQVVMPAYGFSVSSQFSCLDSLWTNESQWEWNAGHTSAAYGVPQSDPGTKMAAAGTDWQYDGLTQVQWGLSYIQSRYGSPCAAWAHWQSVNPHGYHPSPR